MFSPDWKKTTTAIRRIAGQETGVSLMFAQLKTPHETSQSIIVLRGLRDEGLELGTSLCRETLKIKIQFSSLAVHNFGRKIFVASVLVHTVSHRPDGISTAIRHAAI